MYLTVSDVAGLSGVSPRTIRYYDEIGLLKPTTVRQNGYRCYQKEALLRLQQILFFREMDFSLNQIKEMMDRPDFDQLKMMETHREALLRRAARLQRLIDTLDETILHLKGEKDMMSTDLFDGFDEETQEAYAEEAARRWGAETVEASNRSWNERTAEEKEQIMAEGLAIQQDLLAHMDEGAESEAVQAIVTRWFAFLHYFWEPSIEVFRLLGNGYVEDPEFRDFFEQLHPEMPGFFREAIGVFCDARDGAMG
ncbi:MAG: MerR family transcriptional regulator [Candidatus Promineifilaceae bacterium]